MAKEPLRWKGEFRFNDMARNFFKARFHREPESDPAYFEDWKARLSSLNPTKDMDEESKMIYDILKPLYERETNCICEDDTPIPPR